MPRCIRKEGRELPNMLRLSTYLLLQEGELIPNSRNECRRPVNDTVGRSLAATGFTGPLIHVCAHCASAMPTTRPHACAHDRSSGETEAARASQGYPTAAHSHKHTLDNLKTWTDGRMVSRMMKSSKITRLVQHKKHAYKEFFFLKESMQRIAKRRIDRVGHQGSIPGSKKKLEWRKGSGGGQQMSELAEWWGR